MKRIKMMAIFADEMDQEVIKNLFVDLKEGGAKLIDRWDKNTKILFSVPDDPENIPEPVEEYWFEAIKEIIHPCCEPAPDFVLIHEVKRV